MPFLVSNNGRHPLKIGMNLVGRDQSCDVFVPDPHISRKHLSIDVVGDGTITVIDLGSTNGMVINGERVPSAILHPGDSFTVGQTTFLVED
jgi:pSer/pThr/pTyr-binding forkhead associated (FHA) protein